MISKSAKCFRSSWLVSNSRSMSYATNLHQAPSYYVNGIKHINDYDIEEYRPQIQAYLTKRRVTRREVPPKAHVVKDMGEDYRQLYFQQKLVPGEVLYNEKHL
jgi:hypothetical protein